MRCGLVAGQVLSTQFPYSVRHSISGLPFFSLLCLLFCSVLGNGVAADLEWPISPIHTNAPYLPVLILLSFFSLSTIFLAKHPVTLFDFGHYTLSTHSLSILKSQPLFLTYYLFEIFHGFRT
jgi:hypothetical protein